MHKFSYLSVLIVAMGSLPLLTDAQLLFGKKIVKISNPQSIVGKVYYDFTYEPDTLHRDSTTKEVMQLAYSKDYSLFASYTYEHDDSLINANINRQLQQQIADQQGEDKYALTLNSSGMQNTGSKTAFFTNAKGAQVTYELKEIASRIFAIKDPAQNIDWKILDSTKNIGGYICQQAVGNSHGRKYTAWFTTDLPYRFGPRRLNGLPGMILEAYDDRREVVYTLNRIVNMQGSADEIGWPYWALTASQKDYDQLGKALKANPMGALQGQAAGLSLSSSSPLGNISPDKIKSVSIIKGSPSPKAKDAVINNPIDLIDN